MIYILLDETPKEVFTLKGELFKYLVKVRRHDVGDKVYFRSKDHLATLYECEILSTQNRALKLQLISSKNYEIKAEKQLHIGWCVIDPKSIEKVLPSLSEIGVAKITFIACERSQKSFKLDFKRFERIMEASMQQCGRSSYIEFQKCDSLQNFLQQYPQTKVFDFCENLLEDASGFETVLIGCEGGFSPKERELFEGYEKFRLNTPMVLRSESAAVAVASKVLL